MPIRKSIGGRDPTDYYGVVEEVVDADPRNSRTRSFLLIDAVRADRFDRDGAQVIEDRSALTLIRAMSTPKRWEDQFGLGEIAKGDWLSLRLDDSGAIPRAWELRSDNGYAAGPSRSIAAMRRLSGQGAVPQTGDDKLVMNLMRTSTLPLQNRPRISAGEAVQRIGTGGLIEIIVLDVGQASAALIRRNGKPVGFFDLGAPIWFNKGSLPKARSLPTIPSGFVILSHWDFDHFDLGRRNHAYRKLDWYAPDQPVGPNTARFQVDLGNQLKFIDGSASGGGFSLERGTSTAVNDRNGSGYQLRYEKEGHAVLLTGDTGYDLIQAHMLAGVGGLTVPHHAGRSGATPPTALDPRRAIASYGAPNSYRHPHPQTLLDHTGQGWRNSATAKTLLSGRGHRKLYP